MKKIMFNDHFGLTQAVIEGRKTQTRRSFTLTLHKKANNNNGLIEVFPTKVYFEEGEWKFVYDDYAFLLPKINHPKYNIGEVVAVAQSYSSIVDDLENSNNVTCAAHYEKNIEKAAEYVSWMEHPGFNNKMFISPEKMPHQIRITNVRIQRLQDISDDDCLKEGIRKVVNENGTDVQYYVAHAACFETPREAFSNLIDKVSGKGTWESNPYVWVYDFELIK